MANFLSPILKHNKATREAFTQDGEYLRHGSLVRFPELADTLEALGQHGWRAVYNGPIRDEMVKCFGPEAGGLITRSDLEAYRVLVEPLSVKSTHSTMYVPPLLPLAGKWLAHAAARGERPPRIPRPYPVDSGVYVRRWYCHEARFNGSLAVRGELFSAHKLSFFERLQGPLPTPQTGPGGPPSTTHVSVIDAAGNAAAMTTSHGEGNGMFIGNTGILMNNFLGEEDLLPMGLGTAVPNQRLATMMTPTIVVSRDGDVLAIGTGGSNRIRTAILQVLGRMIDERMRPQAAVDAPRLHYENGTLSAELIDDLSDPVIEALQAPHVVRFPERNLFFGGVNLAVRYADGQLDGAGDPRRGA